MLQHVGFRLFISGQDKIIISFEGLITIIKEHIIDRQYNIEQIIETDDILGEW